LGKMASFYEIFQNIATVMRLIASAWGKPPGLGRALAFLLFLLLGLAPACGHLPPTPEGFNPEDYTPITYEQLLDPRQAGLAPGQKIRVEGYFWQYLAYDPAMVSNYLTMARQPRAWSRLRFASLYGAPQMRGYFDRLALTREQQREWRLKLLEHVRIYGELNPLGLGRLYLKAHQVDRLDPDAGPAGQGSAAPKVEPEESPSP